MRLQVQVKFADSPATLMSAFALAASSRNEQGTEVCTKKSWTCQDAKISSVKIPDNALPGMPEELPRQYA